jgi:hypothetical protein
VGIRKAITLILLTVLIPKKNECYGNSLLKAWESAKNANAIISKNDFSSLGLDEINE